MKTTLGAVTQATLLASFIIVGCTGTACAQPGSAGESAPAIADATAINNRARKSYEAGDYPEAEKLYLEALSQRQRLLGDDDPDTLISLSELATLYMRENRYSEAETLFVLAISRLERSLGREHPDTIITVNDLAVLYEQEGKLAEAEPLYLRAISALEKARGPDADHTLISVDNLARLYRKQGRLSEAEALYRRVYEARQRTEGANGSGTVTAAHRLGELYQQMGRTEDAKPLLAAEAQKPLTPFEEGLKRVENYLSIAEQAERIGNTTLREDALLAGLDAALTQLGAYDEYSIVIYGTIADNLVQAQNPAAATGLMQKAANLARQHLGADNRVTKAAEHNAAFQLAAMRQWDKAEAAMRQVIADRERTEGIGSAEAASSRLVLANILAVEGKLPEALAEYKSGLAAAQAKLGPNDPSVLPAMGSYGRYLSQAGNQLEAEKYALQAYNAAKDNPKVPEAQGIDIRSALAEVLLRDPSNSDVAVAIARDALLMQETHLLSTVEEAGSEQGFQRELIQSKHLYRLFANTAWVSRAGARPGRADFEALDALQKAAISPAAIAVMAERQRQAALLGDQAQAAASAKGEALETQVASISDAIYRELSEPETSRDRLHALVEQRKELRQQLADIKGERAGLAEERARVGGLKAAYRLFLPATADELRKTLGPNEALLFLVPTEFGTHIVAFNDKEDRWVRADLTRDQVEAAVNHLRTDLATPTGNGRGLERTGTLPPYDRGAAYSLYKSLIEPVASILEGRRDLFVAVDGDLASLPLAVLVAQQPEGDDRDPAALRSTAWLGERFAITQVPSLQDFAVSRQIAKVQASRADSLFTGFGDPLLGGSPEPRDGMAQNDANRGSLLSMTRSASGTVLSDVSKLNQLPRLPGTATELRAMADAFNAPASAVRLEAQATETAVKTANLQSIDVLAFATHGLTAGEVNGVDQPALVFTPPGVPSAVDDGLLTSIEIAGLKLNANWVILSACNTAAGDGDGEPGLSGLARAFFQAGARSLLVTHWPVRDDVAAELTVATVRAQRDRNITPGEALQSAMRDVRNSPSDPTRAHPAAWAPFALVSSGAR